MNKHVWAHQTSPFINNAYTSPYTILPIAVWIPFFTLYPYTFFYLVNLLFNVSSAYPAMNPHKALLNVR